MSPRRALLAALALLAGACSHLAPQPDPPTFEGHWAQARDAATRRGRLYDRLATHAFASAVYQSLEVREARVHRVGVWQALSPAEVERLLAAERAEAAQYEEFLVAFFTVERPANDLDAKASMWRLGLTWPGGEAQPVSVEGVTVDPTLRQLYPVIGDFDTVYRVRFPRAPVTLAGQPFALRLASALGRIDLDWGKPAEK
jgi:hypothetical protein